jgi:hypothetical protein
MPQLPFLFSLTARSFDRTGSDREYSPQYCDFDYILNGDDILIMDPRTHNIVAVTSAEPEC